MKKIKNSLAIRIISLFISIIFLYSNLAYPQDIFSLRVPIGLEKERNYKDMVKSDEKLILEVQGTKVTTYVLADQVYEVLKRDSRDKSDATIFHHSDYNSDSYIEFMEYLSRFRQATGGKLSWIDELERIFSKRRNIIILKASSLLFHDESETAEEKITSTMWHEQFHILLHNFISSYPDQWEQISNEIMKSEFSYVRELQRDIKEKGYDPSLIAREILAYIVESHSDEFLSKIFLRGILSKSSYKIVDKIREDSRPSSKECENVYKTASQIQNSISDHSYLPVILTMEKHISRSNL